jgi:transcriptional regulator with XRE-family HTH domain
MCYNFLDKMEQQNSPLVFCEWLKRRRKALDLTQVELAERAGCSVGTLRKIESGDRRPSKQLAGLLAKSLEISKEDHLNPPFPSPTFLLFIKPSLVHHPKRGLVPLQLHIVFLRLPRL